MLLSCLLSSDSEEGGSGVCQVRISDTGSHPHHASVQLEGVPTQGVIDTGADITIVGGDLFRRVAAAACLRKSQLKKPDKVPKGYDRRPFSVDGVMDLDVTFSGVTMKTPVYIKMDAPEQLLLSEGVCRQLKIITYHSDVVVDRRKRKENKTRDTLKREEHDSDSAGGVVDQRKNRKCQTKHLMKQEGSVTTIQDQKFTRGTETNTTQKGDRMIHLQPDVQEVKNSATQTETFWEGDEPTQLQQTMSHALVAENARSQTSDEEDAMQVDEAKLQQSGTRHQDTDIVSTTVTQQNAKAAETKEQRTHKSEPSLDRKRRRQKRRASEGSGVPSACNKKQQDNRTMTEDQSDKKRKVGHRIDDKAAMRCVSRGSRRLPNASSEVRDSSVQTSEDQTQDYRSGSTYDTKNSANALVPDVDMAGTMMEEDEVCDAVVPTVRVSLIRSLRLLPFQSALADVTIEDGIPGTDPLLLQHDKDMEQSTGVSIADTLVSPYSRNPKLLVSNLGGFTRCLEEGEVLCSAVHAEVVTARPIEPSDVSTITTETSGHTDNQEAANTITTLPSTVTTKTATEYTEDKERNRKEKLKELINEPDLPDDQKKLFMEFIMMFHHAFSLDKGERGETSLVEMEIETGEADPLRHHPRRMPFSVRHEVARLLKEMQDNGVIQPSRSPWASPVVLVRKKDGTHRFCVDYRSLNTVTKTDSFPLPRIEDLLDQLGMSKYFSTIDLAAGFWQIRMHPLAQEKTAFVTHQGLFEFRVMPFGLTNAPAVFQRLMQQVVTPLNSMSSHDFVSVYLDDIIVFSRSLEDHLKHLQIVIQRLTDVGLKLKPAKCRFIQRELEYLGHIVSRDGLKTNSRLVHAVSSFPVPQSLHEVRRFLGLSSYYRKFIPNFSKIARPLHQLTRKGVQFNWTLECSDAFDELKKKLTSAPVLAYPDFAREFTLETDASVQGVGAVLAQYQDDNKLHPVAYASRALTPAEQNYSITELETLAVVWAISHFHHYLYGNVVTVFTDHTAVKAVLEAPNPAGKHARWWSRVYGRGVKKVNIVYRAGRENRNADALSRNPLPQAPQVGVAEGEVQVSSLVSSETEVSPVSSTNGLNLEDNGLDPQDTESDYQMPYSVTSEAVETIRTLIESAEDPENCHPPVDFATEQKKDSNVREIFDFVKKGILPKDDCRARRLALQESLFTITGGTLYFLDPKRKHLKRVVVPRHLQKQILQETHSSAFGGHFSGQRLYNSLMRCWWWKGMFNDAVDFAKACPECAVAVGTGRTLKPSLHPIPVSRPFQILGIDVMELPLTERGNKYAVVLQDLFTKWPFVFAVPDQKAERLAKLLVEEIIPCFGVPEALLSDRGTNLLSHLMRDICRMLGITKLNTTAYHPQCDGVVERFNRTLKTALRKHAARFGCQWDCFLHGILWAYRNTPHSSTGEKPSFLLYGVDCRSPSEAAYLPPSSTVPTDVCDYRKELMVSLTSARELATSTLQKAQSRYKRQYDRTARNTSLSIGDWVLIRFPQEESGRWRKLSRPWHGPYRVIKKFDPDITCVKVYFPQEGQICVHQSRVCACPREFPAGWYWYGGRRKGPGHPPKWVDQLLDQGVQGNHSGQSSDQGDTHISQSEPIVDNSTKCTVSSPHNIEDLVMDEISENDAVAWDQRDGPIDGEGALDLAASEDVPPVSEDSGQSMLSTAEDSRPSLTEEPPSAPGE